MDGMMDGMLAETLWIYFILLRHLSISSRIIVKIISEDSRSLDRHSKSIPSKYEAELMTVKKA